MAVDVSPREEGLLIDERRFAEATGFGNVDVPACPLDTAWQAHIDDEVSRREGGIPDEHADDIPCLAVVCQCGVGLCFDNTGRQVAAEDLDGLGTRAADIERGTLGVDRCCEQHIDDSALQKHEVRNIDGLCSVVGAGCANSITETNGSG